MITQPNELVEQLVTQMSDKELCGAVLCWDISGVKDEKKLKELVCEKYGTSFYVHKQSLRYIECLKKLVLENAKIPAMFAADVESGPGDAIENEELLPQLMAWGAGTDAQTAYEAGKYTARICRDRGVQLTLSPVLDININPNNPVVNIRAVSDDADRVYEIAGAYARGMESEGLLATCVKHYPGDGVDDRNQHFCTTENSLSKEEWDNTFGKVYRKVIADGVSAVMVAHISLACYDDTHDETGYLPATLSKKLITDLLKGELGFDGCVISDAMSMVGSAARVPLDDLAVNFLNAGGDLVLFPGKNDFENVLKALREGRLSKERLKDAVRRVLTLKFKTGLMDGRTYRATEEDRNKLKEISSGIAENSIHLVRNFDGVLPLKLKKNAKVLTITLCYGEKAIEEDPLSLFSEELRGYGFQVDQLTNPSHYTIKETIDDYDAVFINSKISSRDYQGGTLRIGWANIMTFWRAYVFKNKNVVFISFGDPYKLYEVPFIRTYANAFSFSPSTIRSAIKACLGEIEFNGKSPVSLKGYFEREI